MKPSAVIALILIIGYGIWDSKNQTITSFSDVVVVDGDTLGQDWGAKADALEAQLNAELEGKAADAVASGANAYGEGALLDEEQDPLNRSRKYEQLQTIEDANGNKIVVGKENPYAEEDAEQQNIREQLQEQIGDIPNY